MSNLKYMLNEKLVAIINTGSSEIEMTSLNMNIRFFFQQYAVIWKCLICVFFKSAQNLLEV